MADKNKLDYTLHTYGYAVPKEEVIKMVKALDDVPSFVKINDWDKEDGHLIEFRDLKDNLLFFAMMHSNRKNYLVRTVKDLFQIS